MTEQDSHAKLAAEMRGWPRAPKYAMDAFAARVEQLGRVEQKKAAFLKAMLRDAEDRPWGYAANDPTYRALMESEQESASKKEGEET